MIPGEAKQNRRAGAAADWLLLTGLLMTVLAIVFLPATRPAGKESGLTAEPSSPRTPPGFCRASQPSESVAPNPLPPC